MKVRTFAWVSIVALAATVSVLARQEPPTDNVGLTVRAMEAFDVSQIGATGRSLRIREVEIAPGGRFGIHSHENRPGLVQVQQGVMTELRPGGYEREYHPGDIMMELLDVTHWVENRGTEPVVMVAADIFQPE